AHDHRGGVEDRARDGGDVAGNLTPSPARRAATVETSGLRQNGTLPRSSVMSDAPDVRRYREAARYAVELHWHAPRTWGARKLPHGGRFYAWALFAAPTRKLWTYAEATGVIGAGGVETTELAIVIAEDVPSVPHLQAGEHFELSRSGVPSILCAAHGRVLGKVSESG